MRRQFAGKVAFITGAARGQGRSHAVRFAAEGADIIAVDLCRQLDSVTYPMSTPADLDETMRLVERTGRSIVAEHVDVRDPDEVESAIALGVKEFGRVDFVLANAGVAPGLDADPRDRAPFVDAIEVMLSGVFYTVEAALPAMLKHDDGGAIVITSSTAGLKSAHRGFALKSPGGAGYTAAKHGVVGLMRYYANTLAEKRIRVNTVHPSGVSTPMILNDQFAQFAAEHREYASAVQNLLPVPRLDVSDISDAMVYLCGESGRYITGVAMPVDAGFAAL